MQKYLLSAAKTLHHFIPNIIFQFFLLFLGGFVDQFSILDVERAIARISANSIQNKNIKAKATETFSEIIELVFFRFCDHNKNK